MTRTNIDCIALVADPRNTMVELTDIISSCPGHTVVSKTYLEVRQMNRERVENVRYAVHAVWEGMTAH